MTVIPSYSGLQRCTVAQLHAYRADDPQSLPQLFFFSSVFSFSLFHFLSTYQEAKYWHKTEMENQETVVPSGQHYSGSNRIPNIKQFMERLDREKKDRDAKIETETAAHSQHAAHSKKVGGDGDGEAQEHQETRRRGKNRRTVKDPVTGRDVEIDDMDDKMLKEVQDPQVRSPMRLSL